MKDNQPTSRKKRFLTFSLKLLFCGGALWYLSDKVTYHDYARLREDPARLHRLISQSDRDLVILDTDGNPRTVTRDLLATREQLARGQRDIELGLRTLALRADWNWAVWALLVMGPVTFIISWRLQCLLATQDIPISYRDVLLITFAGNFFNFAMPGTTGGDIYKAYHIARNTHKRTEGITIVLLDRIIGLVSFLLLAAGTILALWRTDLIGFYGRWVGILTFVFFVAAGLFFSRRVRALVRYDKLLERLPLGDKLRRIDQTAFSFRFHRGPALLSLASTIFSHFLIVTSMYFAARSLGIHESTVHGDTHLYWAILLAAVVGFLLAAVPISIQGFGLLEAVFYKVLVEGAWATGSQMLALTLGFRLLQIFWSLPGIVVPWLGFARPRPSQLPTEPTPEA